MILSQDIRKATRSGAVNPVFLQMQLTTVTGGAGNRVSIKPRRDIADGT